jgi:hypothetical protein
MKIALLICGMHRGGTSASTRLISAFGADLGRSLFPADPVDQPTGYWENEPLMKLNHAFLLSRGFEDYLAKDSRISTGRYGDDVQRFEDEITALAAQQFDGAPLIAIKDPRLCLLAPFYERPLAQLGYSTRYIIVVRPAQEVATSLCKRHVLPRGEFEALWIRTMLSAEKVSRGSPRAFVAFRDVVCDPASVYQNLSSHLKISWPTPERDAVEQVAGFFKPSVISRLAKTTTRGQARSLTAELADFLLNLGSGDLTAEERAHLASFKRNFKKFYGALSFRVSESSSLSRSLKHKDEEISNLQSQLDCMQKETIGLQTLLASRDRDLELANDRLEENSARLENVLTRLSTIESSPLWRLSFPIRWLWKQRRRISLR